MKATDVISDGGSEAWWTPAYLAEKHPELKTLDGILKNPKLVSNISFTNKELSQLLAWKVENKASAEETAANWLTKNKAIWSKWVNDSARAKLDKIIQ